MTIKFPPLPPTLSGPIMAIVRILEKNPEALNAEAIPYSGDAAELVDILMKGVQVKLKQGDQFDPTDPLAFKPLELDQEMMDEFDPKPASNVFSDGEQDEVILAQTELIYSSLLNLRARVEKTEKIDPNKVMTFYKNLGTLLEKIIALRERGTEAKEIHDFKNRVLDVLDDVVTPQQRTTMLDMLGHHYEEAPPEDSPLPEETPSQIEAETLALPNNTPTQG